MWIRGFWWFWVERFNLERRWRLADSYRHPLYRLSAGPQHPDRPRPSTEPELRQEVAKLRRRVQKLAALLRLVLALLRTSGFTLRGGRLPDGRAKLRILRAVDRAREYLPLRAVLRSLRMSPESVPCLASHGRPAPAPGFHGAEVLELHDRSVVAFPETSMALPPLIGQRHHRP